MGLAVAHSRAELAVDVREPLDESLVVAGGYARKILARRRKLADVWRVSLVDALGREGIFYREVVVLLLVPVERRLVAIDPEPHAVLLASRNLRDGEHCLWLGRL